MADTKTPDIKATSNSSKFEANRAQQAAQKTLDKSASDYDTGDQVALRQDILNPNLHYGLSTDYEYITTPTESGAAGTSGNLAPSSAVSTHDDAGGSGLDASLGNAPLSSSGLSAPESGQVLTSQEPGHSIDHGTAPGGTLSRPLGGDANSTATGPTFTPTSVSPGPVPTGGGSDVADVNEAVTAEDASETTSENVTLDGSVSATDLDGDAITYSLDGQPGEGAVTFNPDGSYSFNPGTDFDDLAVGESRTVTFNYTADDGHGSTDTGTVTIEVTGTNDAPTAVDLSGDMSVDENEAGAVIGTLSTTDVDTSDTHSYTVSDNRFEVVDDGSGNMVLKVKDGVSLDHESEATVTLTVTADDGHGGTVDQDFTIDVADVNEAVTAEDASETTSENVTLDGSVSATDLDGDAITYSLDGQPGEGAVTFNPDGSYSFNPGTDFDDLAVGESRTVTFNYTADDGHGSTDTGTVTIEVTGTNDAPTAVDLSGDMSVDENEAGAVIGTLSTTDVDTSDTHSYTVSDNRFEVVDDGSGNMVLKVKDGVSLDHESEATVTLTVTADDGHGGTVDQDFTINVADVNEAVTAEDASETTSENVTLDGSVSATDLDGDAITYSLDGQPGEGAVTFNPDGSYSFNPGTDFDDLAVGESRTVTFNYTADDGHGSTDTGTVTIEVTGTNDAPTAVDLSGDMSVDENEAGAVIGTLSTTDVDTSDTHSYTVSDDRFEVVDDGSGNMVLKVKDGVSLDHESEATVTLTVTADDGHGGTVDQDFTIDVADVNEAVTAEDASETTSENVTLDGSVSATDLDGDAITYSLDGQPGEGAVTFNPDGSYSFDPGTDFDDLAVGESRTVTFNYTADDGHGSTDTGTVTIEVTGTNDAPTAVDLSGDMSVDENEAGAVIGTLSTTDVDTSDTHSYTVSDDRFEVVDDGSGNMVLKVKDGVSLDHESEATVTLTVTADDGHGGTVDQDFTIDVADVNEAVTAEDASETTSENVTLDGSVSATDLDGDAITYSLDGQPGEGAVTFNPDGSYSFNPGTDFDDLAVGESRTVTFNYTADDGHGSTDTGTVTIEVTGTNDAPTAVDLSGDMSVDENEAGAVIGTLSTTDVDTSDTHSYTVSDDRFEVVDDGSGNMVLKVKDGVSLDHESEATVTLTVTADDGHGGTVDQDFTIDVADVNEAVTAEDASETTSENVTLDGSVSATDLDGDAITYSLDGQPGEGAVTFNPDGSYSFNPGTDFDDLAVGESRTVTFNYTADDGHGSTDTGTVTIEVTGTNDAPTAVDLSGDMSVDENEAGAVIGTLSTTDVDTSDTHSYTVSDDRFEVVDDGSGNMVLKVKDGVSLDHESEATVTLTVTADDGHGGTVDQDFTIDVADVNEGPTLSSDGSYNFLYNGSFESFNGGVHGGEEGAGWFDGAVIDGWTQTDIDVHENGHIGGGGTDGNYHVDLAGQHNGSLSREIQGLQDGEDYTVSMDLQARGDTGESMVEVVWNGEVIATIDPSDDGAGWHTYSLTLTSGSGDGSDTITFNEVGSDNKLGTLLDNFRITDSDGFGVLENDAGATIADLTVADPDIGDTHSYTVSDSRFEVVDDGTGNMVLKLKDGVSLNYENEQSVDVTITVTDSAGASDSQTLTIQVGDINDDPIALDSSGRTRENSVLDGSVSASDADGDAITYSLDGQPGEGAVTFNPDGSYSFNPGTDFDDLAVGESRTVTFNYTADDGHGSTDTGTVTIEVTGTNDAPTAVDLSGDMSVDENEAGAVIGTLSTTDVDTSDTHSYTVSDNRFEVVDDGSGNMVLKVKDGVSLDHESEATVTLTVTADDGHGGTVDQDFTINVADVNEAPTLTADGSFNFLYNGSFEEFSNGVHGGGEGTGWYTGATIDGWTQSNIDVHEAGHMGLGATDGDHHVDLAGQTNGELNRAMEGLEDGQTYTLSMDLKSRGADGTGTGDAQAALGQSVVKIVWNGEVIATVDPAEDGMGWHTYNFDIVGGSGDGSDVITFIEVGSDNSFGTILDNFNITSSEGFGVLENEAGAEIATLGVADPDNGEAYQYSVDDPRFEVIEQDGEMILKLKDDQSLDSEGEAHVSVVVTVTDSGGLSDSQTLDIQVGDIAETTQLNEVSGTSGDDILSGDYYASDQISGEDGNDTIVAYGGDDTVYGGDGQDNIYGDGGNDTIYGGNDADNISGGTGDDILHGGTGTDTISGDDGSDIIFGDGGADTISGGAGLDSIYGGSGDDTIHGGADSDNLHGDSGNDILFGDAGNDTLYGDTGNDILQGGTGNDVLYGGEGDDTFVYMMGDGYDHIDGGAGADWTDSIEILSADGSANTEQGVDWTIHLTSGTIDSSADGEFILSDDASGTIDFSDGHQVQFENIDRIAW